MTELYVEEGFVERAEKMAEKRGGRELDLTGCMGQLAVADYLDTHVVDDKHYDMVVGDKHISVKTKRRSTAPRPYYDVSVTIARSEVCGPEDYFIFISLQYTNREFDKVHMLGMMESQKYLSEASFVASGAVDENNNFRAYIDMYNMPISKLDEVTFSVREMGTA